MNLSTIRREGTRLIQYKESLCGTKHTFLYLHFGKYYAFRMVKGCNVNSLNEPISNEIKPLTLNKTRLRNIKEYFFSSLNEVKKDAVCHLLPM